MISGGCQPHPDNCSGVTMRDARDGLHCFFRPKDLKINLGKFYPGTISTPGCVENGGEFV